MKLPEYAIRIILVLAFFVAAGVRFSSTSGSLYPYFKGESAMNYRDALTASVGGPGGDLDQHTKKSNWPEGYRPARVRPAGVEYFAGAVLKTATWLSDEDARTIARRLVVFFFSLCVFTLYVLTRDLWQSQAAGLLAAGLVAVFPPLIEATNGREIGHTTFALVVVTLHLLFVRRLARGSRIVGTAGVALSAFALVIGWELAPYYIVACGLTATLFYPLGQTKRRILSSAHLAAFLAGVLVSPHALASRMMFSWQAAFLAACCAQTFLSGRFFGVKRGGAFILSLTLLLTLLLTPLRTGAASYGLPAIQYAYYRIRFLFARPLAPSLLPETVRNLWTADHAHPAAQALIAFFLPLLFFVSAAAAKARDVLRGELEGSGKARVAVAATAAAAGLVMFAIDRSAIALAAVAALPFAGLAGRSLEGRSTTKITLTVAGALLVASQLLWPTGRANASHQLARALGVAHRDPAKILWISLENTDRELVRFVATRTSTKDPFLGEPEVTAVLLTFSGRASVLLAGGRTADFAIKRVNTTGMIYGDEDGLYQRCREMGIRYVLYSIDYLLDTTRYSPLYIAGLTAVPESCAAVSMHFAPERLNRFNLVYENDRYRLFRVTDHPEPVFVTDHPPVYQKDILERNGDTYDSFRDRIGRLMLAYSDARDAAGRGDYEGAIRNLTWCLRQAPRFTLARVALGATLLDNGQPREAKETLMSVIQYAPDNAEALYLAADALAQLGETGPAKSMLDILYGVATDAELINRARLLEALIEQPDTSTSAPTPR